MSADFSPVDVALPGRTRRVAFYPERQGGGFTLALKFATITTRPSSCTSAKCRIEAGSPFQAMSILSG
jgi:hypothetical protein